jgi:hypothetical protein
MEADPGRVPLPPPQLAATVYVPAARASEVQDTKPLAGTVLVEHSVSGVPAEFVATKLMVPPLKLATGLSASWAVQVTGEPKSADRGSETKLTFVPAPLEVSGELVAADCAVVWSPGWYDACTLKLDPGARPAASRAAAERLQLAVTLALAGEEGATLGHRGTAAPPPTGTVAKLTTPSTWAKPSVLATVALDDSDPSLPMLAVTATAVGSALTVMGAGWLCEPAVAPFGL